MRTSVVIRVLQRAVIPVLPLVLVALGPITLAAAPARSAQALYGKAIALDRSVRAAMAAPDPDRAPTLVEFRRAIEAYRVVVWSHPTSGYSDNALWQASQLAVEAFDRFGQERDRQTAGKYLRMLVAEYPTSEFVRRARRSLTRLDTLISHAAPVAPPASTRARATPAVTSSSPTATSSAPTATASAPTTTASAPTAAVTTSPAAATPASPEVPADPRVVRLERVDGTANADATTITVHLTGPVPYREEQLTNPPRVFVDLLGTRPTDELKDAVLTFQGGLVRQLRIGRHPGAVTRVVLDTERVASHSVELLPNPPRLVVTCWAQPLRSAPVAGVPSAPALAAGAARGASAPRVTPPPVPSAPAREPARPEQEPLPVPVTVTRVDAAPPTAAEPPLPAVSPGSVAPPPPPADATPSTRAPRPESGAPLVDAGVEREGATPADAPPPPESPSRNVRGGYSLARQLGLGASRIVIDAGHGGHDPGAMVGTRTEAAITLDIAQRLEKLLSAQPGVDVVLTRNSDVFVPLPERTAIANREGADLFVSIHVNASENAKARGVETYLLDFASNADAERVAARENASTQLTMSSLNDLVKRIALTTKADESRDLALQLQRSMVRRLSAHNPALRDLGVKRAPFVVLIGASMPSVLIEVAFLTNRQEGRLMATGAYRQRVAESVADGIRRYQQALKKGSPVVRLQTTEPRAASQEPGTGSDTQASRDRLQ